MLMIETDAYLRSYWHLLRRGLDQQFKGPSPLLRLRLTRARLIGPPATRDRKPQSFGTLLPLLRHYLAEGG